MNKKFKLKNFRKLLLEIHQLPMPQQQKILDNTLKEWMGTEKQIDDILVLGFRLHPEGFSLKP